MCVAIPMRVVSIEGHHAMVEVDGVRREVNLRLLPQVEPGEYVLVHAGFAIQRVDPQAAQETLELIREILERIDEER
ncbi:MAG: HypC/HybG/HupF family hydrogenase formation chaperone [Nitrospinae bacterium]|nr:HypC/HybG/HupF family hydrogenase formation chaperone [Nitrospinota bacterium]